MRQGNRVNKQEARFLTEVSEIQSHKEPLRKNMAVFRANYTNLFGGPQWLTACGPSSLLCCLFAPIACQAQTPNLNGVHGVHQACGNRR